MKHCLQKSVINQMMFESRESPKWDLSLDGWLLEEEEEEKPKLKVSPSIEFFYQSSDRFSTRTGTSTTTGISMLFEKVGIVLLFVVVGGCGIYSVTRQPQKGRGGKYQGLSVGTLCCARLLLCCGSLFLSQHEF